MSALSDAIAAGQFAITAEITPPLSADPADLLSKASVLKGHVDAANVTDGASARAHMSSVAACALLERSGYTTIAEVSGRDRNRLAIQADVLGAAALGIANIMCRSGEDRRSR